MIVAAFIFSPSQMAELLTNILLSHRNHFLLFLDLACELSARPSKSSPITQTSVLPKALETDHPRGRAPPLVLLDSRKYAWVGGGCGKWKFLWSDFVGFQPVILNPCTVSVPRLQEYTWDAGLFSLFAVLHPMGAWSFPKGLQSWIPDRLSEHTLKCMP